MKKSNPGYTSIIDETDDSREGTVGRAARSGPFSLTLVVVALATIVVAFNPMLEQLIAIEQFGVDRRSWVVAHLDGTPDSQAKAEAALLDLEGVDGLTDSTDRELKLVAAIEMPVSDPGNYRTLGLDGDVGAPTVSQRASRVSGVEEAFPRVAQRPPESNLDLYETLFPKATGVMLAIALVFVVLLAVARARTSPTGSGWMRWLRLVVSVVIPVVLTVIGATLLAAVVWPSLIYPVISRSASHLISGRMVALNGLELAVITGGMVLLTTLLATLLVHRPSPKHQG